MFRVKLCSSIHYGFLATLKYYIIYSLSFLDCMTNFQVCNAMHNRGRVVCLFLFLFCMFSCLYPFVCVLIYFILFFSLKLEKYVFKMFAFFVLKYHVSYNKRVLNERKKWASSQAIRFHIHWQCYSYCLARYTLNTQTDLKKYS